MKLKLLIFLFLIVTFTAYSQNVTNADFNVAGNTIEINYDLDAIADIDIFCSTDGGKTFGRPLENVSGDVGENVMPGNKKAIWHVFAERDMLYSDKVVFKVKVKDSKRVFDIDGVLVEMMKVTGGSFMMGADSDDEETQNDEPKHEVVVSNYCIQRYEVTVALFKKFIDITGYKTDADRNGGSYIRDNGRWELKAGVNWQCGVDGEPLDEADYDHAVIHVSWNDAVAFCVWMKRITGEQFRLPTEAEWEYAARGGENGNGYEYSGSDDIYEVAWYWYNAYDVGNEDIDYGVHQVGTKMPNELGIYDMTGNVAEWCSDIYGDYNGGSQINPTGLEEGSYRVARGGSWYDRESECQLSTRVNLIPISRRYNCGFRLAL